MVMDTNPRVHMSIVTHGQSTYQPRASFPAGGLSSMFTPALFCISRMTKKNTFEVIFQSTLLCLFWLHSEPLETC